MEKKVAPVNRAHVITVSDRASGGAMKDESGPALAERLKRERFDVSGPQVVPDEKDLIAGAIAAAVARGVDMVITTGGTGLGPRDVTPQATASILDYEVPGVAEAMRRAGTASTPMSALSRGMAGVRGRSLVINVPGSVKGATESLEAVVPVLEHAIQLLHGDTRHR